MSDDVLEKSAKEQIEEQTDEEESFAELFESYAEGMNEDVRVGDKVKGAIISIGRDSVFVDTGTRTDGFVEKTELLDDEGQFTFKEGDILELYAVAVTGTEIRLSKAITGIGGAELLRDAFENAIPVEGRVKAVIKGGFQIEVAQRRAFCPISQMDLRYVETPEEYMDQAYEFLITEFDEEGRNIVLSRRKLLNRAPGESAGILLRRPDGGHPHGGPGDKTHALWRLCGTHPRCGGDDPHLRTGMVQGGKP